MMMMMLMIHIEQEINLGLTQFLWTIEKASGECEIAVTRT